MLNTSTQLSHRILCATVPLCYLGICGNLGSCVGVDQACNCNANAFQQGQLENATCGECRVNQRNHKGSVIVDCDLFHARQYVIPPTVSFSKEAAAVRVLTDMSERYHLNCMVTVDDTALWGKLKCCVCHVVCPPGNAPVNGTCGNFQLFYCLQTMVDIL